MEKKNSVIIVIVIVIVALLGLWALSKWQKSPLKNTNSTTEVQPTATNPVKVTNVESSQLPAQFPTDFPLEKGAQVLKNDNSENAQAFEATRQFVSAKTLSENFKIYSDYLKQNKWEITGTSDTPNIKSLSAQKGSSSVTVSITQNPNTKKVVVDISFLQPIK